MATFSDPNGLNAGSDGMQAALDRRIRQRNARHRGDQWCGTRSTVERAEIEHDRHQRPVLQHDLGPASLFGGFAGDYHDKMFDTLISRGVCGDGQQEE